MTKYVENLVINSRGGDLHNPLSPVVLKIILYHYTKNAFKCFLRVKSPMSSLFIFFNTHKGIWLTSSWNKRRFLRREGGVWGHFYMFGSYKSTFYQVKSRNRNGQKWRLLETNKHKFHKICLQQQTMYLIWRFIVHTMLDFIGGPGQNFHFLLF